MAGFFRKTLQRVKDEASEALARQEAALALGKVAGRPVYDDDGALIVDAGHPIDEAVIAQAQAAGKLHALAAAAATALTQDLRTRVDDLRRETPEAQERRALESVDDYITARRYIGWLAGTDVTDLRGAVLMPAGKKIEDEDVRAAREAGLLGALIFSAESGTPPVPGELAQPSAPTEQPFVRRAPLLNADEPPTP